MANRKFPNAILVTHAGSDDEPCLEAREHIDELDERDHGEFVATYKLVEVNRLQVVKSLIPVKP